MSSVNNGSEENTSQGLNATPYRKFIDTVLQGQAIASPHVDGRFREANHDAARIALHGVVINQRSDELDIAQLCETLEIGTPKFHGDQPVHIGGPVDGSRGLCFIQDHMQPESVAVTHEIGLTSSVNILRI